MDAQSRQMLYLGPPPQWSAPQCGKASTCSVTHTTSQAQTKPLAWAAPKIWG